jgi:hypothetical protein
MGLNQVHSDWTVRVMARTVGAPLKIEESARKSCNFHSDRNSATSLAYSVAAVIAVARL